MAELKYDALTKDEERAIAALKRIAKRWPKSLWIYCGSGSVSIMKTDATGARCETSSGGVDPAYLVDFVNIPNDGGDW